MPTPYYTHGFAYSIQYAETAHKQRLLETHMMPRLCPEMKSSLTICSRLNRGVSSLDASNPGTLESLGVTLD